MTKSVLAKNKKIWLTLLSAGLVSIIALSLIIYNITKEKEVNKGSNTSSTQTSVVVSSMMSKNQNSTSEQSSNINQPEVKRSNPQIDIIMPPKE
jgi:hypothetical protein